MGRIVIVADLSYRETATRVTCGDGVSFLEFHAPAGFTTVRG